MNTKRMLVAGIMALGMSVPLAGHAASTPGQASDSETAASDECLKTTASEQSAQFSRRLRDPDTLFLRDPDNLFGLDESTYMSDYAQALPSENSGVMAADATRVYVEVLDSASDVDVDVEIRLNEGTDQTDFPAIDGNNGDRVIVVIQSGESTRRLK